MAWNLIDRTRSDQPSGGPAWELSRECLHRSCLGRACMGAVSGGPAIGAVSGVPTWGTDSSILGVATRETALS